jgi:hypothetical protein
MSHFTITAARYSEMIGTTTSGGNSRVGPPDFPTGNTTDASFEAQVISAAPGPCPSGISPRRGQPRLGELAIAFARFGSIMGELIVRPNAASDQ